MRGISGRRWTWTREPRRWTWTRESQEKRDGILEVSHRTAEQAAADRRREARARGDLVDLTEPSERGARQRTPSRSPHAQEKRIKTEPGAGEPARAMPVAAQGEEHMTKNQRKRRRRKEKKKRERFFASLRAAAPVESQGRT